jgi:hypothetical protein
LVKIQPSFIPLSERPLQETLESSTGAVRQTTSLPMCVAASAKPHVRATAKISVTPMFTRLAWNVKQKSSLRQLPKRNILTILPAVQRPPEDAHRRRTTPSVT